MIPKIHRVQVLLFENGSRKEINTFSSAEIRSILEKVKRFWPDMPGEGCWFNVELVFPKRNTRDTLEFILEVVCYRMPGRDYTCEFPNECLNCLNGAFYRIDPVIPIGGNPNRTITLIYSILPQEEQEEI